MQCFSFRRVEQIDRRNSSLTRFPEDAFRHQRKLTTLLLDGNHIKVLPRNIHNLSKLERLTLSDNDLEIVPLEVFRLGRLQELNLRKNDLTEMPVAVKNCSALRILDLSSNNITSIPDSLTELSNLTSLCINDASLHRLPQELAGLKNLQVLEARDNHLKYLPQSISQLKQLRKLDVGCNDIIELPESIGNLTRLEELWADTNDMEALPMEIGALEQLKVADFSENHLEALPPDLKGLVNLTDLVLSSNTLLALPDSIGSMKSLAQLKCENNQLAALPDSIGNLRNLRELFLTDNMLEHLPGSIGQLERLATLYVDRNHLASIPPELCQCQSLSILNLRQNSLTRIPPDMGLLANLHVIDLCNNLLQCLPISFMQLNLKALWLSDNQSKPLMELQEDTDPETKEQLLTCVLLPQSTGQSQSLENLLQVGATGSSLADPDATSRASQLTGGSHERTARVAFAADTVDRTGETESESHVKLQRHPTPYSRDLKGKVRKVRNVDGKRSPDGSKRSSTGSLPGSESAPTPPVARADGDEADKDKQAKPHKGVAFAADAKEAPDGGVSSRIGAVLRHDTPHPSQLTQRVEDAKSTEEGLLDNNVDEEAVPTKVHFEGTAAESAGDKHVSFEAEAVEKEPEEEGEDEEGGSQVRLSRKDTPKPKAYGPDDSRLRRRDTPRAFGTPSFGKSSPNTEILEEAEEEEEEELQRVMEEAEAKKHEEPPAPEYVDVVAVLDRSLKASLGFSISGGIGCKPPFRVENDFVFVTKVAAGGLAANEGTMEPGDQIVSVSEVDFLNGITHEEAVAILKASSGLVRFVLRRQVNKENQGPQILVIPAPTAEKEDESDERQTETPPTPEESKRNLLTQDKEPDDSLTVIINRSGKSLGMTIVGGSDTSPLPFGTQSIDDEAIYISKIVQGGLADQCGLLHIGDEIISVNGQRLEGEVHSTAVACLVGADILTLIIRHVQPPPGMKEIIFAKADDEKLGLSIRGGSGATKSGNPLNEKDEGIFISKVNAGGAAYRCGEFLIGQRILEVNGNTLLGATHHEAVRVLKGVGSSVKFVVCDGYPAEEDPGLSSLDASLVSKVSAADFKPVEVPTTVPEVQVSAEPVQKPVVEAAAGDVAVEPVSSQAEVPTPDDSEAAAAVEKPAEEEARTEDAKLTEEANPAEETTAPQTAEAEPAEVKEEEEEEEEEEEPKPEEEAVAEAVPESEPAAPAPTEQAEDAPTAEPTAEDEPATSEPSEEVPAAAEVPATEESAADAPSTPKKTEDGVEIGGHSLRSTPGREVRAATDASTPDTLSAADDEAGAAAAIPGDSQPSTPIKKPKKHKKKKRTEGGAEAAGGGEGEDRERKHRKHKKHKKGDGEGAEK